MGVCVRLAYATNGYPVDGIAALADIRAGIPDGCSIDEFVKDGEYDCVLLFAMSFDKSHWGNTLEQLQDYPICYTSQLEYTHSRSSILSRSTCYSDFAPAILNEHIPALGQVRKILEGKSFLYISRELFCGVDYPQAYHPLDYASHDIPTSPIQSFDDFSSKPFMFASFNPSHPHRIELADRVRRWLESRGLDGSAVNSGGNRLTRTEYLNRLDNCQLSFVYDGHGSSSLAELDILPRCALLRHNLSRLRPNAMQPDKDFVQYEVECYFNSGGQLLIKSCDIEDRLDYCLDHPDRMYEIYLQGREWINRYRTPEAVSQYIIDKIFSHDWSIPTDIDIAHRVDII